MEPENRVFNFRGDLGRRFKGFGIVGVSVSRCLIRRDSAGGVVFQVPTSSSSSPCYLRRGRSKYKENKEECTLDRRLQRRLQLFRSPFSFYINPPISHFHNNPLPFPRTTKRPMKRRCGSFERSFRTYSRKTDHLSSLQTVIGSLCLVVIPVEGIQSFL